MRIENIFAYEGSKCRPGIALNPTYITIHNTANESKTADAGAHAKLLQGSWKNKSVSWHYVVDENRWIHCIPDNEIAWHAGDGRNGKGNRNSLAIEICENGDLLKATDNAAELTAYLMGVYNIPIENVVQHNHWSGKDCPRRIRRGEPYGWDTFIEKVKSFLGANSSSSNDTKPTQPVEEKISVKYQVYTNKKWLSFVTDYNETNSNGYAGITNKPFSGLRIGLTKGHIKYRVHTKDGKWWPWVTDYNTTNSSGYAGVLGKDIDMVQISLIDLPGYSVEYRVSTVNGKYLSWVKDYNEINSNGYAGIKGKSIDKIQIRIVKK